jgi:hypothetical protein
MKTSDEKDLAHRDTKADASDSRTAGTVAPTANIVTDGAVFNVSFPFVRDTWMAHDFDEDGAGSREVQTWKPGTRFEARGREGEYTECFADGMGVMVLTVVSVHKPGKYRPRVFYVRRWIDPDGKEFGVRKLRMSGIAAFKTICNGYRFPFEMTVLAKAGR